MNKNDCPFCLKQKMKIIFETDNFYFAYNHFPVVPGHSMVITKRHIRTEPEIAQSKEFKQISDNAWLYIEKKYSQPITFVHPPSLQSVFHYHRHYIPSKGLPPRFVETVIKEGIRNLNV